MRTKAEYYAQMNQQKNLYDVEPTFKPKINQGKKSKQQDSNASRHEAILEKGKEYQEKIKLMQKEKSEMEEQDPELTFKPKINQTKPKKGAAVVER